MKKCSGIAEIIIESGVCASGSRDRVMTGKHINRAFRVHKLVLEALERPLLVRFEEDHPRSASLSKDIFSLLMDLIENPDTETASKIKQSEVFRAYFDNYSAFKSEALNDIHGKTAQFWERFMSIIQTILVLIRATKEMILTYILRLCTHCVRCSLHMIIATMQGMYLATL